MGGTGTGFINTTGNSEHDSMVTAVTVVLLLLEMVLLDNRIGGELLSSTGGCDEGEGQEGWENGRVPDGTAHAAAQRILALATESLDMIRNVTGVVRDSLGCAEAYVFQFYLC